MRGGVRKNLRRAAKKYTEAADRGHPEGQYNSARCYMFGIGVEINEEKARHYYTMASNQGYRRAHNELGVCLFRGIGGDHLYDVAFQLFLLSIRDRDRYGPLFNLGCCYCDGKGVHKDEARAIDFFHRAVKSADEEIELLWDGRQDEACIRGTIQSAEEIKRDATRELERYQVLLGSDGNVKCY
jgi:hypothetical protein